MEYGGCERRTTKKDLRRKRAVYKKGGKFRTRGLVTSEDKDSKDKK